MCTMCVTAFLFILNMHCCSCCTILFGQLCISTTTTAFAFVLPSKMLLIIWISNISQLKPNEQLLSTQNPTLTCKVFS